MLPMPFRSKRQDGYHTLAAMLSDLPTVAFLLLVAGFYFFVWATSGVNSRMGALGWNGWFDQSSYLKSATALAHGNLQSSQHWYPLGYPLLGAPFVYVTPDEPFFFPNLALLLCFCLLYLRYFRPLIGPWLTITAFFASTALPISLQMPLPVFFPLFLQFVVPWNTIPVAVCGMAILLLARDFKSCSHHLPDLLAGFLLGYVFVTRPPDLLPIAVAGGFYFFARMQSGDAVRRGLAMIAGSAAVVAPALILFLAIHGTLASEYAIGAGTIVGFGFSNLAERAYAVFVDASTTYGVPLSVLVAQPWLGVLAPFAVAWAIANSKNGMLPIICVTLSVLTYVAYNDFSPLNVFKFFLIHYIVWIFPMVTAGGIAGAMFFAKRSSLWIFGLAALPAIAVVLIKLNPVTVGVAVAGDAERTYKFSFNSRQDVDALDLAGATTTAPYGGTIETIGLSVNGRELPLYGGYRMFAVQGGLRVLFDTKVRASTIEISLPVSVELPRNEQARILATRFEPVVRFGWPPDTSMLASIP